MSFKKLSKRALAIVMIFCVMQCAAQVKPVIDRVSEEGMRLKSFAVKSGCEMNKPVMPILIGPQGFTQWEVRLSALLSVGDYSPTRGLPLHTGETFRSPEIRKAGYEWKGIFFAKTAPHGITSVSYIQDH